jgi:hypothetical protein
VSRRQVKVDRLVKRVRVKVIHKQAHQERVFARRWSLEPEPGRPFHVELRVARTRHLMRTEIRRLTGTEVEAEFRGAVTHYQHKFGHVHRATPSQRVAIMFLNAKDIQYDGANIIAHECTHAGLAYARNRKANLDHMPGEEVAAYAVGYMMRQVCAITRHMRIW